MHSRLLKKTIENLIGEVPKLQVIKSVQREPKENKNLIVASHCSHTHSYK